MAETQQRDVLENQVILITGGTGSFGQTFVKETLANHRPRRVIVFSRDELKQHEMRQRIDDGRLNFFVGDVRDRDRLTRAFEAEVDIVVHAAALKQVPSCEYNPFEAVKTNIIGAQNVIDAAIDCRVRRVMNLSTDKAVAPVNLYGATKLCAEKLFVQGNSYAAKRPTRFSCVRYGNVVGSRGSVIPVLRAQREAGRVTVTDPRMTRFWITIEQGVQFVIRCLELMRGGEIFVPIIPSMGITDLVEAIAPGCAVDVTGIRPGEKINETLVSVDEARHAILAQDMYVIYPELIFWGGVEKLEGAALPDGFSYTSDRNELVLTRQQLQQMVGR